jgi:hypothetical protein
MQQLMPPWKTEGQIHQIRWAQEFQMHTFRFGRKLSLPSTIAIKHQIRMLMADDRAKSAEEEAKAQSTDIPQMKVAQERLTT